MKMTDESALAVLNSIVGHLRPILGVDSYDTLLAAREHISARLAADQQKGGGEPVAFLTLTEDSVGEEWPQEPLLMLTEAGRKLPPGPYELYAPPQPSIPAPAQQDGKASGGEESA